MESVDPIQVTAVTVKTGRLMCDVVIPEEQYRTTTPQLAAFVTQQYPDLPRHACVNGAGHTFGDVINHTSTVHLLEHLTISIQTRETAQAQGTFVGTSEWINESTGEARIEISFRDDLEALRAFNNATRFLNTAVLTCQS